MSWRRRHHPDQGLVIDAAVLDEIERQARAARDRAKERVFVQERERERPTLAVYHGDPEPAAQQVWAWLFPGQPWPDGWRVAWVEGIPNSSSMAWIHGEDLDRFAAQTHHDTKHITISLRAARVWGDPVGQSMNT